MNKGDRRSRSDAGFTLIETLVALMVLATATAMFARSMSMASGQLAGADRLTASGNLSARLFAEFDASAAVHKSEGADAKTGLKWRRTVEGVQGARAPEDAGLVFLIEVEILDPAATLPILKMRSVATGFVAR